MFKISADKIFGGQTFSADKIFGSKSDFRKFSPPKLFPIRYMRSPDLTKRNEKSYRSSNRYPIQTYLYAPLIIKWAWWCLIIDSYIGVNGLTVLQSLGSSGALVVSIYELHIFYRQLGCLAFSLRFLPKTKQFLSNFPASDWTFSFKTAYFC